MKMTNIKLRFPMAVGQRYIPGTPVIVESHAPNGSGTSFDTDRVPDASRVTPPMQRPSQDSLNPVSLSVMLNPGFPIAKIESPFYPIISHPGHPRRAPDHSSGGFCASGS